MPTFSIEYLRQVGAAIFAAAGAPPAAAEVVAELLADANAVGHDSHGVIRIPQYISTIEKGEIVPHAEVEVVRQTAAAAVLDGHWGFGQVVMNQAVEMGLERAGHCGVAAITVKNSNHIGRLGSYVERVATANMIGLLCANSHGGGASVAPWGGIAGRLGTNPLAGGWPDGEGGALVLDITTSVVAEGKVRVKRNRGEPVPEGWIIDAAGQPSTDPADFYDEPRGSLLPFGGVMGHRGYGLGVVVELLGGALSGAGCARGRKARIGNGCFLLVIDIGHFQPLAEYAAQVRAFAAYLRASPKAAGVAAILLPGEVEKRARQRRQAGVVVEEETWRQILDCAQRVGATLPSIKELT